MSTVETAKPTPAEGASEQTPEVLASAAEGECSLLMSFIET